MTSGHTKRSSGEDRRNAPTSEQTRAQLERILASAEFIGSKRTRSFLRFVVEEALDGRADRLKAYTIATAVLDRDQTFDPQSDPIVRIEAGRLRRRLERYYLVAAQDDPIRIDVPKGSYSRPSRSALRVRHPMASTRTRRRRSRAGSGAHLLPAHWLPLCC